MVNFLTEITEKFETVILPTPLNTDKQYNIYYIDINDYPKDSYWLDWGGYYDNFVGTQIALYYDNYLEEVNDKTLLFNRSYSYFIENRIVYINIPKHPWLYSSYSTSFDNLIPYLSTVLDPNNPSNNIIRETKAETRLEIPSLSVKLSDNIAGITLSQGFSITLSNNDGYFDNDEKMNLFNTPIYLKKSTVDNPNYEDFKLIRYGLIDNTSTSFDNLFLSVSDKFKSLEEPINKLINNDNFPFVEINSNVLNKPMPLIYGEKRIKLLNITDNVFFTAENASHIKEVYDKNGNIILINPELYFNKTFITNLEADEALIVGNSENKIGYIIKDIINRTKFAYDLGNFNTEEFEEYANNSFKINILINSGSIKNAIENVIKNDMAFFIQQSDGRFTIRKYGKEYTIRNIDNKYLTKKPEKTYDNAHEKYFSSCIINFNNKEKDIYETLLYNKRENWAEDKYRRKKTNTFNTDLIYKEDAEKLAEILSERFTNMRQSLKISVGIDTSNFELLDTLKINLNINNRQFNNINSYIIKEINSAQDILTIEEI